MPVPSDLGAVAGLVLMDQQPAPKREGRNLVRWNSIKPDYIPDPNEAPVVRLSPAEREAERARQSELAAQALARRKKVGFLNAYEDALKRLPGMAWGVAVNAIEAQPPVSQEAWLLAEEDGKNRQMVFRALRKPSQKLRAKLLEAQEKN